MPITLFVSKRFPPYFISLIRTRTGTGLQTIVQTRKSLRSLFPFFVTIYIDVLYTVHRAVKRKSCSVLPWQTRENVISNMRQMTHVQLTKMSIPCKNLCQHSRAQIIFFCVISNIWLVSCFR